MTDENGALAIWTPETIEELSAKARQLVAEPEVRVSYISTEFFELAVLLGEAAKKVLRQAAQTTDVNDATKLYGVGQKLSGQWLEVMLPVSRRHAEAEAKKAKKDGSRQTKQVPGPSGHGDAARGTGRRGTEGHSDSEAHPSEGGRAGEVGGRSVGVSDG